MATTETRKAKAKEFEDRDWTSFFIGLLLLANIPVKKAIAKITRKIWETSVKVARPLMIVEISSLFIINLIDLINLIRSIRN